MLYNMGTIISSCDSNNPPNHPEKTDNYQDIPKSLDIFYKSEDQFLPIDKTFDDLTPEEKEEIRQKYRFSPYVPGIYQGITGFGKMLN